VKVDAFRRGTQRTLLDQFGERLNGRTAAGDDARALIRAELRTLSADVTKAMAAAGDRATRAHLEDVKDQIAKILDPKFAPPVTATTGAAGAGRPGVDGCWNDYGIYPELHPEFREQ
jgi:hypothetical protein